VNARLLVKTLRGVTVVPSSAIQHNADAAFVYAVANNRVHVTKVTPGAVEGDTTAVTGIGSDTVVADSTFEKLRDGASITIAPAQGSAGSAGSTGSAGSAGSGT